MENPFLIELSVKYGLNDAQVNKLVRVVHGMGVEEGRFEKVCRYVCENELVERPAEELVEELKRVGLA